MSRKILIMEWIEGQKLAEYVTSKISELVDKVVECMKISL